MKELKNELLKQIKINFRSIIISVAYMLFKSKFVLSPLRFSDVQWLRRYQESILMFALHFTYFNVCIARCYFRIWFVFIVNCNIKHTRVAAIVRCSAKVILKVIHKGFKCKCSFEI